MLYPLHEIQSSKGFNFQPFCEIHSLVVLCFLNFLRYGFARESNLIERATGTPGITRILLYILYAKYLICRVSLILLGGRRGSPNDVAFLLSPYRYS
jgi:hypothetical protein